MAVEILELLEVEARGRFSDMVEIEPLNRLVAADDLGIAMAPSKAEQVIADRLGQHSELVAIGVDAECAVALAELCPVRAVDQRDVRVGRLGPAHRPDDRQLAKGIVEM